MTIKFNKAQYEEALEAVKSHCMCANFKDSGGVYLVTYPEGFALGGARVAYQGVGKTVALKRLVEVMERHWKEGGV